MPLETQEKITGGSIRHVSKLHSYHRVLEEISHENRQLLEAKAGMPGAPWKVAASL